MDGLTLIYAYLMWAIGTILNVFAIKMIFSKKPIPPDEKIKTLEEKIFFEKHRKKIKNMVRVLLSIFICGSMWLVIIPGIIDSYRVFTNNYEVAVVEVVYDCGRRTARELWIDLVDENGDELNLMIFNKSYKAGEKYLVYYLPNMRYGTFVEKIK